MWKEASIFIYYIDKEKKDGSKHAILNLRYIKKHFTCNCFKMESFLDVFKILTKLQQNCWVASLKLKVKRMRFTAFIYTKTSIKNISNFRS